MKKYRLKQWYPSLHKDWAIGDVVVPWKELEDYYHVPNKSTIIYKEEVKNNPDFWELIEEKSKPLFITEDGVEVLSDIDNLYAVNLTYFNKTKNMLRHSGWLIENSAYKVFYHEHNADAYIKENKPKPLFVTDDGVECFDRDGIVWNVRNNNFDKIKIHSIHLNDYDFEHKVFFHESNADEYIWRNKPLFSYEDFIKWGNVPYQRIIEQLAIERSKK